MKKILLLILMLVTLLMPVKAASAFDLFGKTCTGDAKNSAVCQDAANQTASGENSATKVINTASNIIAIITAIAGVIMIIIGGFALITSSGNAESVAKARRRIVYSLVGIVVVALAWILVRFITDKVIK